MPTPLKISVETLPVNRAILEVEGEIDISSAPLLQEVLVQQIASGCRHLAVDLHDVGYMDSSGLAVLIDCFNRLRPEGGSLSVLRPSQFVHHVLELSRLARLFPIYADRAQIDALIKQQKETG